MTCSKFINLEHLIAVMPGHVYWLDHNNVYQGCNDLQAAYFNLASRHEIAGKTNLDLAKNIPHVPVEMIALYDQNNLEVMRTGIAKIIEEPIILDDGQQATMLTHKKALLNDSGEIIGLLGISMDITYKNTILTAKPKYSEHNSITMTVKNEPRILLVEDHIVTAKIVEDLLIKLGCKVDIVHDGKTAVESFKRHYYDLVFLDIGLPDIDGYEAVRRMRASDNTPNLTLIIGLTAHIETKKKQDGVKAGMDLVLTKPLTRDMAIAILKLEVNSAISTAAR